MSQTLSNDELESAAAALDGWRVEAGRLVLELKFSDFSSAFAYLTRIALLAESHNHHPEIYNSYASVRLELLSHDAGGVTERDLELARAIAKLR